MSLNMLEIMAPAGDFDSLQAALDAGADAVYFGVGSLNMRSGAAVNFSEEDLPEVVMRCHAEKVRAYLTINTIIYDSEMDSMRRLCRLAKESGVDQCIAGDIAVITYLRKIGMCVHITVQCNICNIEAVRFYSQYADVMVLARELPLSAIADMVRMIHEQRITGPSGQLVQIEIFAHGALCMAISGRCYLSLGIYNTSANRGRCYQPCRRKYEVCDLETGTKLVVDNQYVMSPKDLCTIRYIGKMIDAGVSVFKIEGRGRSADYVSKVVRAYREAADSYRSGTFSEEKVLQWEHLLSEVFNRGFWHGGYYLGKETDTWCGAGGNQSIIEKKYIGIVSHYFPRSGIAEVRIETSNCLKKGDRVLLTGPATGAVDIVITEMRVNDETKDSAEQGDIVTFPVSAKVRPNNKVYLLTERKNIE